MAASKYLCDALAEHIGWLKLEDSDAGIRYLNTKSGGEIMLKDWDKAQHILLNLALWNEMIRQEDVGNKDVIDFADNMLTYIFTLKIAKTAPQDIVEHIEDVLYDVLANGKYEFKGDI